MMRQVWKRRTYSWAGGKHVEHDAGTPPECRRMSSRLRPARHKQLAGGARRPQTSQETGIRNSRWKERDLVRRRAWQLVVPAGRRAVGRGPKSNRPKTSETQGRRASDRNRRSRASAATPPDNLWSELALGLKVSKRKKNK